MIICGRCKNKVTHGRNIKVRHTDKVQKIVCYACYERAHNHRSKRSKEGRSFKRKKEDQNV